MEASLVPAAQYLRMSTDHQQYSLQNQADAIARYAVQHGFTIVKTYSDAARSGLHLKNRAGLKQLLKDVMEGQFDFNAVLVYDVSRWGRFQDTDEAAHYEYLCKSSGVPIHYCAEMFTNDNSTAGLILKTLKRTMAGEYSRELSVKVRAGLERLAKLGYKLGRECSLWADSAVTRYPRKSKTGSRLRRTQEPCQRARDFCPRPAGRGRRCGAYFPRVWR